MSEAEILERLYGVIEQRKRERPEGSYVVTLLDGGLPAISEKIREEAAELIEAAEQGDVDHVAREAADLIFHAWVLLGALDLPPQRVFEVLADRFGIGGHDEKASRAPREDR